MFYVAGSDYKGPDIALDIVVWTPSEKKLDVIRLGEGEDRHLSF